MQLKITFYKTHCNVPEACSPQIRNPAFKQYCPVIWRIRIRKNPFAAWRNAFCYFISFTQTALFHDGANSWTALVNIVSRNNERRFKSSVIPKTTTTSEVKEKEIGEKRRRKGKENGWSASWSTRRNKRKKKNSAESSLANM